MGFGLLFSGYFFLLFFPISAQGILPNFGILGCILMFSALKKLIYYCPDYRSFKAANAVLIPFTLSAVTLFVLSVMGKGGAEVWGAAEYIIAAAGLVADVSVIAMSVLLFLGIRRLSDQVELPNMASRSIRMVSYTAAYGVTAIIAAVAKIVCNTVALEGKLLIILNYIDFAAFVLEYVFIFLCLAFFFSCYARICLEGDEDMPYQEDLFDKISNWFKRNKK